MQCLGPGPRQKDTDTMKRGLLIALRPLKSVPTPQLVRRLQLNMGPLMSELQRVYEGCQAASAHNLDPNNTLRAPPSLPKDLKISSLRNLEVHIRQA